MRIFLQLLTSVLLLSICGCLMAVVPVGSRTSSGVKYSAEALAFLDLPGTTRDEVVASLGPPLLESQETRTLVYEWERTERQASFIIVPDWIAPLVEDANGSVTDGASHQWALLVAYDVRGVVSAHKVRQLGTRTLEEECADWSHHRNNKP
ncbi:MAG: hypothetical protein JWR69_3619 [Pedosphaera sp.]|nr:hypothetical protein [Pedosphaera sp.]